MIIILTPLPILTSATILLWLIIIEASTMIIWRMTVMLSGCQTFWCMILTLIKTKLFHKLESQSSICPWTAVTASEVDLITVLIQTYLELKYKVENQCRRDIAHNNRTKMLIIIIAQNSMKTISLNIKFVQLKLLSVEKHLYLIWTLRPTSFNNVK